MFGFFEREERPLKFLKILPLQVYYPDTNTVKTIDNELPQEKDKLGALQIAQMASYDNGNKLGDDFNGLHQRSQTQIGWRATF
jgi:hypothetical protein